MHPLEQTATTDASMSKQTSKTDFVDDWVEFDGEEHEYLVKIVTDGNA